MEKMKVNKDLESKTLTIERLLQAPKEKVWRAFSDKDWFTQWWGPEGWETSVKEFDFTPGGRNHYGMKCVDENQGEWFGKESWGIMRYETIDTPDRITYKDFFADAEGNIQDGMPQITAEIDFVETPEGTKLVTISRGESAEDIEKLVNMGMVEGFSSSADKLERFLASQN